MTPELIQRLITLVQKHGDKVVLADPAMGRAVVVLDLEEYERLREATSAQQATLPVMMAPATASASAPVKRVTPQNQPAAVASAPQSAPAFVYEPPLRPAPAPAPEPAPVQSRKVAQPSQESPKSSPGMVDLTQEGLIDKINRDIGAWKTAQERKRTEELQSAVRPRATQPVERQFIAPRDLATSALEDEEKFFLEPIE